jgi:histidine ammonia-lyase/tyrosine ammonia-lyase
VSGGVSVDLDSPLTLADLEHVTRPVTLTVSDALRVRVNRCQDFIERHRQDEDPIYGTTTGFGPLVGYEARPGTIDQGDNVVMHLTAGHGPDLDRAVVRAAMLIRTWTLAQGRSGASMGLIDHLAAVLATDLYPAIPAVGSLGASGDLVPLAYLAQALQGRGHAYVHAQRMPADQALTVAGLPSVRVGGREALALVNGTSVTTAAAGLAISSLLRSRRVAVLLTALLADVLGCTTAFADPHLLAAFGHPYARCVGAQIAALLDGCVPSPDRPLQEPYSIRCTPQLLGAAEDALVHARHVVGNDLTGISDNPLFFPEDDVVAHGGNFFGQPTAFAADLASLVATQMGNLAERQLDLLLDPARNGGLPPMLAADPGRQHGLQGVQLAATALIADMRRTTTPASIQSLPTNGHNQDVIPLGTQAALVALDHAHALRLLHGSLAVALRQAAHLRHRKESPRPSAPACAEALDRLADLIEPIDPDRPLDSEVSAAADLLDQLYPVTDMTDEMAQGQS